MRSYTYSTYDMDIVPYSYMRIEIFGNHSDEKYVRNFPFIMPYFGHIVERDVLLQSAHFFKGEDTHDICY